MPALSMTYIGGPTARLEFGGLRILTDPTFDPAGSEYRTPVYVLHKTQDPALSPDAIGALDVVLLSHDHHFDNLDRAGRQLLKSAATVITTTPGAERIRDTAGNAVGLEPWEGHDVTTRDGRILRVTATPCRHGPAGSDRGPVIGFLLAFTDPPTPVIYVSGDTVWYEDVAEVSLRFNPDVAILFGGAARVAEVGPAHLTMTAAEMVTAARAFAHARIVPLHFEGWAHFSESRADIQRVFDEAGLTDRLLWPPAGHPLTVTSTAD